MENFLNKIHYGKNLDLLGKLPDNSIDLVITSPPYKEKDGFSYDLIHFVSHEIARVLKDKSLFFLNFGHLAEDKFRPFKVCEENFQFGLKLNETITWEKTQFKPIQGKKRLNNLTEFIFLLHKGKMPNLNRLSIGVPYKDKTNIKRYSGQKGDLRCGGNIWKFGYKTVQKSSQKLHFDEFPEELPLRCIKLANLKPGSIVLDPFSGSFTTQFVAQQLGFNWIGVEKNYIHCQTAQDRFFKEFNEEKEIVKI